MKLTILIFLLFTAPAHGHRGGIDSYGCHHNRKAGDYECHKGEFKGRNFSTKAAMIAAKEGGQPEGTPKTSTAKSETFLAKVISVIDGDTLDVFSGGEVIRIRLADIDAPEMSQPYGPKARQYVIDQSFGKIVQIKVDGTGAFGRIIATIILSEGSNLNREILKAGHARWYKKYSQRPELGRLEKVARKDKIGLWQEKNDR